ncbi:hypothetical protein GCK32_021728 [Trichostrongylus colubriformis]|uniref:Uncharacterized protein n=1 Tax=Trichostrongylus colubriformis TaxID=6319 RepID=A0AAN8G2C6_TRICO
MKSVPVYFCVRVVRRRFEEMEKHRKQKMVKRRFKDLKSRLKLFTIDVHDLLEFPPKDPEVARLLHQATGLPIGTAIIPARKIRLRVPNFSFSDLSLASSGSTVPMASAPSTVGVPDLQEEKPKVKDS